MMQALFNAVDSSPYTPVVFLAAFAVLFFVGKWVKNKKWARR